VIEEILEAERDEFLGYQRYQRKDEKKGNSRNGYSVLEKSKGFDV